MIYKASLILVILCSSSLSFAKLTPFERRWSDPLPTVPDLSAKVPPQRLTVLARLKWYQNQESWEKCLQTTKKMMTGNTLELWIAAIHVQCLKGLYSENSEIKAQSLSVYFNQLSGSKKMILDSPFKFHRERLSQSFLDIAKRALKENDPGLLRFMNLHYDIVAASSEDHQSIYYEILGDISLQKKENPLAGQNFLRSYSLSPRGSVEKKLKELELSFSSPSTPSGDVVSPLSPKEDKAWRKVMSDKAKNRYVALAKNGARYLNKFPGAPRAQKVADSLLSSLRRIVYKRQKKFESMKRDVLKQLKKAPGKYVLQWTLSIFGRGYYSEALNLAEKAISEFLVSGNAAEPMLLAGKSAYFLADWQTAKKHFRSLIEKYPGSAHSFEGTYYLGMLLFRNKDFTAVIPLYEKFLLSPGCDKWELQIRYWLWRSLQAIKSPRVALQEDVILKKFPLTYYGLRVRWETTKNLQTLFTSDFDANISVKYWWTPETTLRWGRIRTLLASGWLREAGQEIDLLPEPTTGEGHLLRAQLWNVGKSSVRTMMALRTAIDMNPKLLSKTILKMAFPQKYLVPIKKYGGIHEIDGDLILSVIRQESGFIEDAVSPSNAIGLMQLVPGTAKETAKWIRLKSYRWPESLIDPVANIRMGTHYMRRMIKKYKGNVPLAMAAYNVGPGNMDRWLRQRKDLQWELLGLEIGDDMWMDELPWGETSFYAKAVLRNYLLYKIIFSEEESLGTPPWNGAQSMIPYGKSS